MIRMLGRVEWKIAAILLTAGLLGVAAVLPYVFDLLEGLPIDRAARPEVPMPLLVLLALVQNGILLAVAIVAGMVLSERVGLRMPLVRSWVAGEPTRHAGAIARSGMLVGAATGVAVVALEAILFLRHLPPAILSSFGIPLWKRLLAGILYGGLTEELFMRLFLVSLVAWLLGRWWRAGDGTPARGAFWTAILFVAVLFGLGHLPATAVLIPLTPAIVVRALVLNGIAGIAFGYLYWRRGLEAAMVGHMSAHLVMQVPGAMLLQRLL